MISRTNNKKPYAQLIHKLYMRTIYIIIAAIITVLILRSAGQGRVGNWITSLYCRIFNTDWETAVYLYWKTIRQYYEYILVGTFIVFFLILFRILLSGFTKYFDEIINGIYHLANEETKEIHMSPELNFVSNELNLVKNELEKRTKDKEDAEKRKDELVVYLAHDIKTPLTSVIGYLNLLEDNPEMPENQKKKYIHISLEKANRLEKLINEFFEITRYHAEKVTIEKTKANLSYMMVQIIDEAYPLLKERGKKVSTDIDDSIEINVDTNKLARVFNNILKNAINYSTPGSTDIHISARQSNAYISICFENDGDVAQDKLIHIFDKFYRLDDSRQSSTGGAGLGLAIAKDIVELHHGTIEAHSENGKIRITVNLPV